MRRLTQFLRSVLPADPYQLLFLTGVVFLFISPRLPWSPSVDPTPDALYPHHDDPQFRRWWTPTLIVAVWPITIAALYGYFLSFLPRLKSAKRVIYGVFLPPLLSVLGLLYMLFYLFRQPSSIFDGSLYSAPFRWIASHIAHLPTGLYFSMFGLVLIAVFTVRLSRGVAVLPVALANDSVVDGSEPDSWHRMRFLIFVLLGPLFLLSAMSGVLFLAAYEVRQGFDLSVYGVVYSLISNALTAAMTVFVALWILGKPSRNIVRNAMQLPEPRFVLYSALVPLGISVCIGMSQYLPDRAFWAAQNFGRYDPPKLSNYLDVAAVWHPWLLGYVFGAFAEEIVFRGLLLPAFLRRYGLQRGIFLVGALWSAVHFRTDSYSGQSVAGVLLILTHRIIVCLAMNYVFSWMTLRWKSIIPAAVAHTISNVLVVSGITGAVPWNSELRLILWMVLAYALFHFWPLVAEKSAPNEQSGASLQPAV